MTGSQLPALQVVLPLLAAPVAMLVPSRRFARVLALAVAWMCCATAVTLLMQVQASGPISYAFGGWAAPYGIEYRVDLANAFVLVLVSTVASVVLFFGPGSAGAQVPESRVHLFYAMLLLCLTGLLGMAITGDLFNVFVFLEISSLSSYTLVGMGSNRRALTAAFSYLVMGSVGGIFVLLGIGILYQLTGTLNIQDLAGRLPMSTTSERWSWHWV